MRHVLVPALTLALCGCSLFSAAADIPEVCVTMRDRTVAGVAPGEPYRRRLVTDPLDVFGGFFRVNAEITAALPEDACAR